MNNEMSIGWFGVPGAPSCNSTLTHLVIDGKPACGARIGSHAKYEWCFSSAEAGYCECKCCERKRRKILLRRNR